MSPRLSPEAARAIADACRTGVTPEAPAAKKFVPAPKHAPGPWRIDRGCWTYVVDAKGRNVAEIAFDSRRERANAILITEAPAMLGALKEALMCLKEAGGYPITVETLETAIAKAEGRS